MHHLMPPGSHHSKHSK
jgi:hypothetical protein